jgi:hypothetical protein
MSRSRVPVLLVLLVLGALTLVAARPWEETKESALESKGPGPFVWVPLAGVRDEGRFWIRLDSVMWVQEKDASLYVAFSSVGSEPLIVQASAENRRALGVQ